MQFIWCLPLICYCRRVEKTFASSILHFHQWNDFNLCGRKPLCDLSLPAIFKNCKNLQYLTITSVVFCIHHCCCEKSHVIISTNIFLQFHYASWNTNESLSMKEIMHIIQLSSKMHMRRFFFITELFPLKTEPNHNCGYLKCCGDIYSANIMNRVSKIPSNNSKWRKKSIS